MKQMFFGLFFTAVAGPAMAQVTTVTFKPGAAIGQDASIAMMDNNCITNGQTLTHADINFSNYSEMFAIDWTFNAGGCPNGTFRNLFRFSQLATIPSGATILSATLKLYGVPSSSSYGNSSYPGAPFPTTNESWLRRVTSNWTESGVTWNTQPSTTATGAIALPATTSRWSWNWSTSSALLVSMVQGWVSSPASNYGFLLRLQNEAHYRGVLFASSDHADSTLWPELTVTYEVCDANFKYCASSSAPHSYSFSASSPGASYLWTVDGTSIGTGSSVDYSFAPGGTYTVCLSKFMQQQSQCKQCVRLCIPSQNQTSTASDNPAGRSAATGAAGDAGNSSVENLVPQELLPVPDAVNAPVLNVSPNPATNDWQLSFEAMEPGQASFSVFDMNGKRVETKKINVKTGVNRLSQQTGSLAPGLYYIEITGEQFVWREKAVKL